MFLKLFILYSYKTDLIIKFITNRLNHCSIYNIDIFSE